ncbi:tyrosine-type recombinase/integrase [Phenylobacterium deserti]|nr:tyrosine-type recombinase/integrase [Phenylobacterium deserti]
MARHFGDDPWPPWALALARMQGAYAPNTILAYARCFERFERWCAGAGFSPLPAEADAVAGFVSHLFPSCARNTVVQYLRSIRAVHRLAGEPDVSYSLPVQLAFRRGRREHGRPAQQAYGLTAAMRDQLVATWANDLHGMRNRALLRLAYDGLLRRSELIRLEVEDFEPLPDGTGKILVRRAKNDPFGQRYAAYLSRETTAAVQAWLKAAKIERGPLLRAIWRGRPLPGHADPRLVNQVLALAVRRAKIPPDIARRLNAHSFRIGAAQDLAAAGRSLIEIMRAGRWRHLSTVAHYVQCAPVNVWADQGEGTGGGVEEKRLWRSAEQWNPREGPRTDG